jgi:hypothetical protein
MQDQATIQAALCHRLQSQIGRQMRFNSQIESNQTNEHHLLVSLFNAKKCAGTGIGLGRTCAPCATLLGKKLQSETANDFAHFPRTMQARNSRQGQTIRLRLSLGLKESANPLSELNE